MEEAPKKKKKKKEKRKKKEPQGHLDEMVRRRPRRTSSPYGPLAQHRIVRYYSSFTNCKVRSSSPAAVSAGLQAGPKASISAKLRARSQQYR